MNFNYRKIFAFVFAAALLCLSVPAAADTAAARKLERGKILYNQRKYDDARDNFIDVLLHGDFEQQKEANLYINRIQLRMGNIEYPVFEPEEKPAQQSAGAKTAPVQIGGAGTFQETGAGLPGAPAGAGAGAALPGAGPGAAAGVPAAYAQPYGGYYDNDAFWDDNYFAGDVLPPPFEQDPFYDMPEDGFANYYQDAAVVKIEETIKPVDIIIRDLNEEVIASLQRTKGVKVHIRNGRPDALDIEPSALFGGAGKFNAKSKDLLENIYALMILNPDANYVVLPPGSYTEDVTLLGIKQAMDLSTTLVQRGISAGKINYNLGLYNENPPEKFRNLDNIGVVFDFTDNAPSLEKPDIDDVSPLLSVGVLPLNQRFNGDEEGLLIVDFSVIQTLSPVTFWSLQVVEHSKDGSFYIVRELEGDGTIYSQIHSNGRKNFTGPKLTPGKYTVSLKAQDADGHHKYIYRTIVIENNDKEIMGKVKEAKAKIDAQKADSRRDYNASYLWKRAGRTDVPPPAPKQQSRLVIDETAQDDYGYYEAGADQGVPGGQDAAAQTDYADDDYYSYDNSMPAAANNPDYSYSESSSSDEFSSF